MFIKQLARSYKHSKQQSFLSSIFPVTILCEVIGVWPITVQITKNELITQTSILKSLHTLLLLIIQAVIPLIFSYEQLNTTNTSINVLIFEEVVNKFLYTILGCIFISFAFAKREKLMRFCRYVFEIDDNLRYLCEGIDYRKKRKQFSLNILCGIFLYLTVIASVYFTEESFTSFLKPILIIVIFAVLGNFSACVSLVKERYELINECAKKLVQNRIRKRFGKIVTPLDEIKIMAKTCDMLCDAANLVNDACTFQLVCFVVLVFLGTLFGMFSTVKLVMMDDQQPEDISFGKVILKNCSMSIFMVWMLVLIIMVCSSTQNAVRNFKFYNNSNKRIQL